MIRVGCVAVRGVILGIDSVYFYGWGELASGLNDADGDFTSVSLSVYEVNVEIGRWRTCWRLEVVGRVQTMSL